MYFILQCLFTLMGYNNFQPNSKCYHHFNALPCSELLRKVRWIIIYYLNMYLLSICLFIAGIICTKVLLFSKYPMYISMKEYMLYWRYFRSNIISTLIQVHIWKKGIEMCLFPKENLTIFEAICLWAGTSI